MRSLKKIYDNHKNGIIFTLCFHIIVFIILNISQFRIKQEFKEAEIIISFPEAILDEEIQPKDDQKRTNTNVQKSHTTNIASNRATNNENDAVTREYLDELEKARNLVNDVSRQLSKEIPTIDDLKMPEEKTAGLDPDSIMKKLYSGNSNVEYYLENRYHIVLPIPVYLAQNSGVVTVNIVVNADGKVINAEPEAGSNIPEIMLSYAKTAALRTRFNAESNSGTIQKGYIKYTFVAQ